MPLPQVRTTYVRPLCERNNGHCNAIIPPTQTYEAKESMSGSFDKENTENLDEVKQRYLDNLNSVHSKLFADVEEIQKWKTLVKLESKQKNKKVEELYQTIESQRKVVLDLQLQNENLSYQLSEEIQQRTFTMEKFHSTKELCSALKKHYNTLQTHFEYRNTIVERVNAVVAERSQTIEDLKNKFEKIFVEHSEKIDNLNDALAAETNKALNLKETLEQQLEIFQNEKESYCTMLSNCETAMQKLSKEVEEEKNKSGVLFQDKKNLEASLSKLHAQNESNLSKLKKMEEDLKISESDKAKIEKNLISESMQLNDLKKDYEECLEASKCFKLNSEDTVLDLKQTIMNLESKICNLDQNLEEEKRKNENLSTLLLSSEQDKCDFQSKISEAEAEIVSFKKLKMDFQDLSDQFSILSSENKELNEVIEKKDADFLKFKLEEELATKLYIEKEENLKKDIEECRNTMVHNEVEMKCLEEKNAEFLEKLNILEEEIKDKSAHLSEHQEKILCLQSDLETENNVVETLRYENIVMKDIIDAEKESVKICLDCESFKSQLKEMETLKVALKKTENELNSEKIENMDNVRLLDKIETNYSKDMVLKETEIVNLEDQVKRLEMNLKCNNVKQEHFNRYKTENKELREDIKSLKLNINKQEDLKLLKTENAKLKKTIADSQVIMSKSDIQRVDFEQLKFQNEKQKEEIENLKSSLHAIADDKTATMFCTTSDPESNKKDVEFIELLEVHKDSAEKQVTKTPSEKKSKGERKRPTKQTSFKNSVEPKRNILNEKNMAFSQLGITIPKENSVEPKRNILHEKNMAFPQLGITTPKEKSLVEPKRNILKENDVDYSKSVNATPKEIDIAKTATVFSKPCDSDSSNSDVLFITEIGKIKSINEEKSKSQVDIERNKWENDSSGSEYLKLTFDKELNKVVGLSPFNNEKAKLDVLRKPIFFGSNRKGNQEISIENELKMKLEPPFKKNKCEPGNLFGIQHERNSSSNLNAEIITPACMEPMTPTLKMNFGTPSTPVQRKMFNTPSIPTERKFFKTPLINRKVNFKKTHPQNSWFDFLKSKN